MSNFIKLEDMDEFARNKAIAVILEDLFGRYGIVVPDEIYEDKHLEPYWTYLYKSIDATQVKKAIDEFDKWSTHWHNENTPLVKVDDMSKMTLFKIMKLCTFGDYVNEMGVNGTTKQNLVNNTIAAPALHLIIKQLEKENPRFGVERLYPEIGKRKFIAGKLKGYI